MDDLREDAGLSGGPECATVNDVGPRVSLRRRRARGGGVIPAPVSSFKKL